MACRALSQPNESDMDRHISRGQARRGAGLFCKFCLTTKVKYCKRFFMGFCSTDGRQIKSATVLKIGARCRMDKI